MTRTKKLYHAAYIRHFYHRDFPDAQNNQGLLETQKFEALTQDYFAKLAEKGYSFAESDIEQHTHIKAIIQETYQRGLELIVIDGFNIFNSMRGDATLTIVKRNGDYFAFLKADYGTGRIEVFPILSKKREYGQPLLLHQILKRVEKAIK